ncbi:MAG TPA: hypothetical protein VGQ41_27430 [Pyrinomonadaceae bacterium]|jgi:hypothetical protein|nr:hypothetical protein [Pyrinomonadaceae bacterium]
MSTVSLLLLLVFSSMPLSKESWSIPTFTSSSQQPRKFDEYTDTPSNDAKARLDNFAVELQNDPRVKGYIIAYGGRSCPNKAEAYAEFDRSYLVSNRGIDGSRIVVVNGGRRSDASRYTLALWLVPEGGSAPAPSPTLKRRCPR